MLGVIVKASDPRLEFVDWVLTFGEFSTILPILDQLRKVKWTDGWPVSLTLLRINHCNVGIFSISLTKLSLRRLGTPTCKIFLLH